MKKCPAELLSVQIYKKVEELNLLINNDKVVTNQCDLFINFDIDHNNTCVPQIECKITKKVRR